MQSIVFFFAPIIWVTWDHNSFVFRIQHSLVELYLAIKAKILLSKVALKLFLEVKCVSFQENAEFLNLNLTSDKNMLSNTFYPN